MVKGKWTAMVRYMRLLRKQARIKGMVEDEVKREKQKGADAIARTQSKRQRSVRPTAVLDPESTKSPSSNITWGTRKRRRK
jgi:hypothetical protein